jgi:diaminohydroxyphosphoribosylaminopyrimidine deaminase/5-amino-6-(5-phosphoribosylamino)uracil reductase
VASKDPNPIVGGRGLSALRRSGIEVVMAPAPWRRRAAEQNEKFFASVASGRPFVLAKWASTLDGRIASAAGESRWITGEPARRRALLFREEYDAVLVGAGTVAADDPLLTRRLGRNRTTPHRRIVLDGRLRIPEAARVLRGPGLRLVATAVPASHPKARRLAARGIEVWSLPARKPGTVDLDRLLRELAGAGVASVMVEGGARTHWGFFQAGLVDRVAAFLAPRVLGGDRARGSVGGKGFALAETPQLSDARTEWVGEDLLVTGRLA